MRVSEAQLQGVINYLNQRTKNPISHWNKETKKPNAGHFYFGKQLGGYRLEQVCEGGGARDISPTRGSKREMFNYVHALLKGMDIIEEANKTFTIEEEEIDEAKSYGDERQTILNDPS